jgi:hypothetical protein
MNASRTLMNSSLDISAGQRKWGPKHRLRTNAKPRHGIPVRASTAYERSPQTHRTNGSWVLANEGVTGHVEVG